jgi:toxin ParE1/3/4
MNVRYTERAFQDREDILYYLAARSEAGVRNVLKRFDEAARLLSEQPLAGLPTDFGEVRVLFVGRYPYKFFYRVRQNSVEILHIRHTARLPLNSP